MIFIQDLEIALALFHLVYDRQPRSIADLSFLRSVARHGIINEAKSMINPHENHKIDTVIKPSSSNSQAKELAMLKLELKAAKELLKPDAATKIDKYSKAAKNRSIKLSGIGDLGELNAELEFLESCRTLNIYAEMESQKQNIHDFDFDLINAAAESFVCSAAEKLDLKLVRAALLQNYKEYYELCGQVIRSIDKASKRILDFFAIVQNERLPKLVMKLILGYLNLLVYSTNLELQFLTRYGMEEHPQDEPKNQVDQLMNSIINLIMLYGKNCCDRIFLFIFDFIKQNPQSCLELISILSKFAASLRLEQVTPELTAYWTKAFKTGLDLPAEAAFMLDAVLLQFPKRSELMEEVAAGL